MKVFDERTAHILATILLFLAIGAFVYGARSVLISFLFAILFAYVLDPWISWMERRRKITKGSRTLATLEVYAQLILAVAISVVLFGSRIASEGRTFVTDLPSLIQKMSTGQLAREIGAKHGWSYRTQLELQRFLRQHSAAILSWLGSFLAQIAHVLPNLFWIALVPILAFFLLKDGRRFEAYTLHIMERGSRREFIAGILADLNEMMTQYIRAQLIIAGLALVFYMSVLSLLRFPYALILGFVAGLLEFLPTIGPAVSAAAILGVGFLAGYHHLLIVVLILGVWRVSQDYVIFPRIAGNRVKLHPLAAIFAILTGVEIGGIAGAYLSIPIMASVMIVRKRWQRTN